VLPEDDANRQLANGFLLELHSAVLRKIQVLEEVGGWYQVLERFESDHVAGMDRYATRHMVLLIDFDRQEDRLAYAMTRIPDRLRERVFVLGVLSEPEDLRRPLEEVGSALARDCRDGTETTWNHELLRHNAGELARLREIVRPILF